jgi:hypothetical protein
VSRCFRPRPCRGIPFSRLRLSAVRLRNCGETPCFGDTCTATDRDGCGVGGRVRHRHPRCRRLEPSWSYYVDAAKVAAFDAALARRSGKLKDYPNPDLAAEVDISRPKINRQGIYAALQVSEVRRVFDEHVSIEQLGTETVRVPVSFPRQDSLPAAGPALPDGIGYPQGFNERFHI